MKKITQLLRFIPHIFAHDCVCDNCSYYDDHIIDDGSAFVPHVKSQKGWIQRYFVKHLSRN